MNDRLTVWLVACLAAGGGFMVGRKGEERRVVPGDATMVIQGRSVLGESIPRQVSSRAETEAVRRSLARGVDLESYSDEDFERDLRSLGRGASPIERYQSLSSLLENLTPENLPRVLEAFKDLPPTTEYLNEYQMLLYAWTKFDRAGAIDFVESLVGEGQGGELSLTQEELLKPVVSSWASENPKQALAWYEYLPKEQQTHHLKLSLMSGWATKDPQGAADYLQTQPADQNREYLAGQIASHLFKQSPEGAARWAEGLEEPKFKEQVFEELAEDWVSVDPDGVAKWLGEHVHQAYAWEAVEDLGRGWVASDSEAATEWFEALPDGPAKMRGIEKMALSWADHDLPAMGEWLNTLPDSSITDRGVKAYSERLVEQAPQAAVESALGIMNDDVRNETVQDLAQEWYANDPEAALGWAEENAYPTEALERSMEIYAKMNAQQLAEVTKMINRDQVSPERMRELRQTQATLQEQAVRFEQAIPQVERSR